MNNLTPVEKAIINAYPFAKILSSQVDDFGFALLTDCPLMLLDNNTLIGHLSRHNPVLANIENNALVKVIYTGPHGYISPRWHSEQKVPTWNYASISLNCRLSIINCVEKKLYMLKTLSSYFDPQWSFNAFDNEKNTSQVHAMLNAITVFKLEIVKIQSKFKLSQNRSLACRQAFQHALMTTGNKELANLQLLE